ncbi:MAG: ABC transporter substrate-binding protein [Tissierellia bacterium]|nr:ABC transporter substrate-binding protein [Tissierellia bacterium]
MKSKLVVLLLILSLLFTTVITGCSSETSKDEGTPAETATEEGGTEEEAAADDGETIKIGAILPLTGSAAATGVKLQAAMEVAQEIINGEYPDLNMPLAKDAGLPNLGGKKIEIIFADHQGNPEMAKSEAERLIEEGVVALVGAYQSSCTKPASQTAEQYGIPFVCGSSSSAALTERGLEYFVRIAPNDDMESEMFYEFMLYLNENYDVDIKTVAVAYIDNEFGVHAKEMAEKWYNEVYKDKGFEYLGSVAYATDVTNVDTEVQQIKDMNPDAIFHASYIADITMFVNKYRDAGVTPKCVLNYCGGFQDTQFVVNLGKDSDYFAGGAAFTAAHLDTMPELKFINDLYREKTNSHFDGPALEEFASIMVVADAINQAGSLDSDAIMEVIRNTEFDAPYFASGAIRFNESGQNEISASYIVQIQDQEYQAVWPEDIATSTPWVPFPDWSERK